MNASDQYLSKCPGCTSRYDLRNSLPVFSCGISKNKRINLVFCLCSSCEIGFRNASPEKRLSEGERMARNVFCNSGDTDWSITTDFFIAACGGCYLSALLGAADVPWFVYEAYNDGLIDDLLFLPGGRRVST